MEVTGDKLILYGDHACAVVCKVSFNKHWARSLRKGLQKTDIILVRIHTQKIKIFTFDTCCTWSWLMCNFEEATQYFFVQLLRCHRSEHRHLCCWRPVTNAAVQRDSSSQLTGVMITPLVIGVILALAVLVVAIIYVHREKPA